MNPNIVADEELREELLSVNENTDKDVDDEYEEQDA